MNAKQPSPRRAWRKLCRSLEVSPREPLDLVLAGVRLSILGKLWFTMCDALGVDPSTRLSVITEKVAALYHRARLESLGD
jgi:hypothetical protein